MRGPALRRRLARMRRMLALSALAAVLAAGVASAAGSDSYMIQFRMPSNNIFCAYEHYAGSPIGLRCEIRSGIKPTPPRPKTCGDAVWAAGYWLPRLRRAPGGCLHGTTASHSSGGGADGTS